MNDDDLEWRLHTMLTGRAEQLESSLTGAALREHAGPTEHPGRAHPTRRVAAMLAAAAAVVALAVTAAEVSGDGTPHRPTGPIPGGGVSAPPRTDPPSSRPSSPPKASPTLITPSESLLPLPTTILLPSTSAGSSTRPDPTGSGAAPPPGGVVISEVPHASATNRPSR